MSGPGIGGGVGCCNWHAGLGASFARAWTRRLGRVLLVEDVSDVLVTTRAILERAGFAVVQAGSGSKALALVAAGERFDVLVSDYAMPGLDGVGLVERARAIRPGLPAVLVTGYAEVRDGAAPLGGHHRPAQAVRAAPVGRRSAARPWAGITVR